ncbi:MAG: RNA 2',3'-cyclic phosphodiesterase [Chlorobi bacterium]|nr:RNA 2',3'-cyclic phosphodiesterase [Chlorobiota bacterium]
MASRLFIAAEIPLSQRENLIRIRDEICENEYCAFKWEPIEKLHLTLKFLGDTDEELIPEIKHTLYAITSDFKNIEVSYSRFGLFFRDGIPSILWAGLNYDYSLKKLSDRIQEKMTKFGFKKERRKFKPHITLSRLKYLPPNVLLNGFTNFEFEHEKFQINEIVLYKSELQRSGSIYKKLKNFRLGDA